VNVSPSSASIATAGPASHGREVLALVSELVRELHPPRMKSIEVGLASRLDRDLGIDSLGRTELISRIERAFRVRLPATVMGEADTVGDILEAVTQAQQQAGPADIGRKSRRPSRAFRQQRTLGLLSRCSTGTWRSTPIVCMSRGCRTTHRTRIHELWRACGSGPRRRGGPDCVRHLAGRPCGPDAEAVLIPCGEPDLGELAREEAESASCGCVVPPSLIDHLSVVPTAGMPGALIAVFRTSSNPDDR